MQIPTTNDQGETEVIAEDQYTNGTGALRREATIISNEKVIDRIVNKPHGPSVVEMRTALQKLQDNRTLERGLANLAKDRDVAKLHLQAAAWYEQRLTLLQRDLADATK